MPEADIMGFQSFRMEERKTGAFELWNEVWEKS
jgi:hypothetical protein